MVYVNCPHDMEAGIALIVVEWSFHPQYWSLLDIESKLGTSMHVFSSTSWECRVGRLPQVPAPVTCPSISVMDELWVRIESFFLEWLCQTISPQQKEMKLK